MEELLNCILEICCGEEGARRALLEMFRRYKCKTPEECVKVIFDHFTLAPREFVEVKKIIGKLALANSEGGKQEPGVADA